MLKIGITGGIGSGKSTVSALFALLGVPVYYADKHAKELINSDKTIRKKIKEVIGEKAYNGNSYNSKYVANKVFDNEHLMQRLNNIVHPAVKIHFENWLRSKNDCQYIIKEAAIMSKLQGLDKIILVAASEEIRIQRILSRDSFRSKKEIADIISRQKTEKEFLGIADFVIENEKDMLIPQVLALHEQLIA